MGFDTVAAQSVLELRKKYSQIKLILVLPCKTQADRWPEADKEEYETWEIVFELRIRRSRYIRIYADVLVVTDRYVFSLEFKMKDKIDPDELSQAAKYSPYLEVIFGPEYEVIPVLVLTRAEDLYRYEKFGGTTAEVPVCSGDMLFNVLDEYQGIMKESDER